MPRTVDATATTGNTVVQVDVQPLMNTACPGPSCSSVPQLVESMLPQLAVGSRIPRPRNEIDASSTMFAARISVE